MSPKHRNRAQASAAIFAALGDETRLLLVARLSSGGQQYSITELAQGSSLTRQAITKHLRVLERAKIVHGSRRGRESLFEFDPRPLQQVGRHLEHLSLQWDHALARLKSFVEADSFE